MPAGLPKVEVGFQLNADGILTVSAKELRSGIAQQIEVKPQYGLTDAEVEKMLLDSLANAQQDIEIRMIMEAQTESNQLIYLTEKFLEKNKSMLSEVEITGTLEKVEALRSTLVSKDKKERKKEWFEEEVEEGSMQSATHKPEGAKFGGYWKGTDKAPPKPGQGVGGAA